MILTATLGWLLAAACAQAGAQTSGGVADPQAAVPATRYQPAIERQAAPAPAASPDQGWRAANATVGSRNPMRLTMPGADGEHQHDAAPAASAATGKAATPHEHHAGMDMQGTQGMQCMAGGGAGKGKDCCAGMHGAGHAAHGDGMQGMKGMQCMADGKCACCAGKDKAGAHASHAGMAMGDGGCCGHSAAAGEPAACKPGGACGCCNHKEAM
jgi:hypothetical protein